MRYGYSTHAIIYPFLYKYFRQRCYSDGRGMSWLRGLCGMASWLVCDVCHGFVACVRWLWASWLVWDGYGLCGMAMACVWWLCHVWRLTTLALTYAYLCFRCLFFIHISKCICTIVLHNTQIYYSCLRNITESIFISEIDAYQCFVRG